MKLQQRCSLYTTHTKITIILLAVATVFFLFSLRGIYEGHMHTLGLFDILDACCSMQHEISMSVPIDGMHLVVGK